MRTPLLPVAATFLVAATPPAMDPANSNRPSDILAGDERPILPIFTDFSFGDSNGGGKIGVDVSPLHGEPPIIVDIAGWYSGKLSTAWLDPFLHDHGFRLASVYDVHGKPEHDGAALAANYAKGIAALIAKADRYRFDPHRIILKATGEGADLAALLATDPAYLRQAGVPFESIRGVILFDGAGFDLPAYLATLGHYWRKPIEEDFGKDPELQVRISAIRHVEPPNAPAFLFETVKGDSKSEGQANVMAAALQHAGTAAEVVPVSRSRQNDPSTYPGHPTSPANAALLHFLQTAVGR